MPNPRGINQYTRGRGTSRGGPAHLRNSKGKSVKRKSGARTYVGGAARLGSPNQMTRRFKKRGAPKATLGKPLRKVGHFRRGASR